MRSWILILSLTGSLDFLACQSHSIHHPGSGGSTGAGGSTESGGSTGAGGSAGAGGDAGAGGGGATTGQTLSCAAPECCVPLDVNPDKIIVYQSGGQIGIDIILDVPATSTGAWDTSVDVSLSWGPSVTCTKAISISSETYVVLTCPFVPLDGAPACDSTFTLTLRPRSSTFADTPGTQAICVGTAGARLDLPVRLTCPVCPDLSQSSNFQLCDFPNATCNYPAYFPNGNPAQIPCRCIVYYGVRAWSCSVP